MRNINLLNILLLCIIAALALHILPSAFNLKASFTMPAPKASAEEQETKTAPAQMPSIAEYAVIAEQNLFHFERKIPAEKKDAQQAPKPEFVLYGTLISGDTKLAFLEDLKAPYSTAGMGKRQKTLQLGHALSGFVLNDIQHDRVVMVKDEEKIEIKVTDNQNKKSRSAATASPTATASASAAPPADAKSTAGATIRQAASQRQRTERPVRTERQQDPTIQR